MANKIISSKFYVDSLVQTLSGDIVNIEQDVGTLSGNIENIQQDIIDLSGNIPSIVGLATETFVTSSISEHNINISSHQDIRQNISNVSNSLSSYATVSYVASAIAEIPNPDMSQYAPISGATFLGNIFALNLTGTNTGDQDLSSYALTSDINIIYNSLSAYVPYTGATNSIDLCSFNLSANNIDATILTLSPSFYSVPNAIGGIVTKVGDYTVHTFNSSETFTVNIPITAEVLVVGGGGGGGGRNTGGGGGAGGLIYNSSFILNDSCFVTIGSGGAGGIAGSYHKGSNGGNTYFSSLTAWGGGGGGHGVPPDNNAIELGGLAGGSGGGGGGCDNGAAGASGGIIDPLQGNIGGLGTTAGVRGGGGGGAGGPGENGNSVGVGSNGGPGLAYNITGTLLYYAAGGGGGANASGGLGGSDIGGDGGGAFTGSVYATDGAENTGSGGGGCQGYDVANATGGDGGSGVVIVRYISSEIPSNKKTITVVDNTFNFEAGAIFNGDITASNISGNNTGDQDLSSFITSSYVTSSLTSKVDVLSGHSNYQTLSSALIQNKLSFTPIAGVTSVALGDLVYNADEHTLSFGVEDGSLELGKEVVDCYTNLAGVTLLDGDIVSIIGVSGNRQAVALTDIRNSQSGSSCIGMVTRGNTVNQLIRVTKIGKVHNLNTLGMTEGMPVYVSTTNPGKLTQTPPLAPNTFIHVGIVEIAHQNTGTISVDVRISPRFQDLSDVDGIPLTTSGQFATWHPELSAFDFDKNINNYALTTTLTGNYVPYIGATQGLNLGSYDLSAANLEDYKDYAGFENRTDSTISINASGVFSIAPAVTNYNVYTHQTGKRVITGTQTVSVTADQTLSYIYVDNTGTLRIMNTAWDIADGSNIPCAIVFKDSTEYALSDERHSYERNKSWHKWAHFNIGSMYRSGFTGTFTSTTLSVTQGVISDEDIIFDSLTTKTTTTLWYRNATSGMRMIRNSSVAKGLTAGNILAYDNGSGTLQPITNNKYATNWVYATNDPVQPIYTVISQGDYTSITNARNAASPTINLSTAEWKLIYRVIYQRTTAVPTGLYIEAADYRTVQTGVPTAAVSTDHAALINRDAASSHPATAISYAATTVDAQLTKLITQTKSFVVTNPSSTATYSIWRAPYDLTITGIHGVITGGLNLVGMLTECDSNGLNPVKINSTDMTLLTSNVTLSSFSNPSIDSGDYIGWINTSISGDVTKFVVSFEYIRN